MTNRPLSELWPFIYSDAKRCESVLNCCFPQLGWGFFPRGFMSITSTRSGKRYIYPLHQSRANSYWLEHYKSSWAPLWPHQQQFLAQISLQIRWWKCASGALDCSLMLWPVLVGGHWCTLSNKFWKIILEQNHNFWNIIWKRVPSPNKRKASCQLKYLYLDRLTRL